MLASFDQGEKSNFFLFGSNNYINSLSKPTVIQRIQLNVIISRCMNKLGKVITVFLEKLFDLAALFVSGTVNCGQSATVEPQYAVYSSKLSINKGIDFVRYTCVKQLVT